MIVGLGNPGQTYFGTRHNVGFLVVQALAEARGVSVSARVVSLQDGRPVAVFGDYQVGDETVRLLMPLTMMNESGDAMKAVAIHVPELLIVCDDVHLPLGRLRLRPAGGAGGHHGLESCLSALGTEDVSRLRVGVGTTPLPSELETFVLSKFGGQEWTVMKRAIAQAAQACESWVTEGMEAAMNRYNRMLE